ncbi:phenoloxidase-activating factor 2-like [Monomorium pharaonis]|uniref:phenoloxidase-activating factor 2-like n=1 Tax=Monomorium pharaonis TaxID=307658 RepID=UPI001746DCA6|nr:phenoloxidase-activating factor 2-like [Monomorium pharaonis]
MNNVLLFLLSLCQLLQQRFIFAQMTFTDSAPTTYIVNQNCQCYLGTICPTGTGGIDIRIVNTGATCPSGYVYCCAGGGGTNNPSCGIQKITPSAHPVGQAPYGAYPWMVAILTSGNVYVGGGVLISTTHVLTVAHKVAGYVNGGIKARLGEWNAQGPTEPYPQVEISISRVTLHPQYNSQNLQNDIAVLKLSSAAPTATSPSINTACLPSGPVPAKTRCWVSGWGKDAFVNGMNPNILKEVDVPVLSQADCQTGLRKTRLGDLFVLDNSFMCAGGEAGKDACTGDGGSPLVCSNNGPYQVVGLVTWGIGCAGAGVPGVYTNVNYFYSWIMQQMT